MTRLEWLKGFWRRVAKLGPDDCWPWTGATVDGYGQLKRQDGKNIYAHRASVEIDRGRVVPRNRVVMHICDNPLCVNPRHLRVATQKDNVADMHAKGRANTVVLKGDEHGSTKVSEANVVAIHLAWASRRTRPVTQQELAQRFGVSQAQISRIVNGKRRR